MRKVYIITEEERKKLHKAQGLAYAGMKNAKELNEKENWHKIAQLIEEVF
jgi:hypothetical protein